MNATEKKPFAEAMAFYHKDGLPAAWQQAMKFAGEGGRLATMPDIVAARLASKPNEEPWETYFTTLTAEYLGFSKQGNRILIVAHGVGPMSTLDGIRKAYRWEYKDKNRDRRGGRITAQKFLDLESGKFGEVEVVDFNAYCRRYEYPFLQVLRVSQAITDPVLKARLGPLAIQYLIAHRDHARAWHHEQVYIDPENKYNLPDYGKFLNYRRIQHLLGAESSSDPFIIQVEDASNCCYTSGPLHGHRPIETGYAFAHLISTGRLMHLHHEGHESLVLDVSCHEWWNGVRLVGIRANGSVIKGIHAGPNAYKLLRDNWKDLLVPTKQASREEFRFRGLVKIDDQWFTQYPKQGDGMDTWEPEYMVTSIAEVDKPVVFRTTVGGYHGFFKFGVNEVQAIAPPTANAYYFVGEPENEWHDGNPTHQTCLVQFYRIEADTTKRLMRTDRLCHDYETMMNLLAKQGETI